MPYPPEHKAKVRRRIVRSARDLFNRKGYSAVSIDEVMASAGLTRGGFYSHFKSKAELYRAAIGFILEEHPAREWDGVDFDLTRGNAAEKIVDAYLSPAHLADIDRSCPLVGQFGDASRGSDDVRDVYLQVLKAMAGAIEKSIEASDSDARHRALAATAVCVGGLSLARAADPSALAEEILEAARRTALGLVRSTA